MEYIAYLDEGEEEKLSLKVQKQSRLSTSL